tara:strand:+ start:1643 stop:2509 length:867 start_codon:yes stop_codon:yes gene_type:complete
MLQEFFMNLKEILVTTNDGITKIILNRPDKLNAWTTRMGNEVKKAIEMAGQDKECRCIVVTGSGRGFCAGADMGGLKDIADGDIEREIEVDMEIKPYQADQNLGPQISKNFEGRFAYMYNCPKPIIAMINGACAGIGLIFSLYADLRFATNEAKFTTAFASRGLIAEHGIAWLLPRLVGEANALDLLLTARIFKGAEAESLGLINKSLSTEELEDFVNNYAKRIAESVSPRSMTIMKRQIRAGYSQTFVESLKIADKEMFSSFEQDDFKEGVESFVESRAPKFRGIGE